MQAKTILGRTLRIPYLREEQFAGAVDVFVYDASHDSDGGEWATAFPKKMRIVAYAASVQIRNAVGDTLHTTLDFTGYTVTAVSACEGVLCVATTTGLARFKLADDDLTVALDYTTATSPAIVNNAVNDVAMTVLPDAPTDPATVLPVPTIAVATDGGVSVINDDGTVADSSAAVAVQRVDFDETGRLCYGVISGGQRIKIVSDYSADGFNQDGVNYSTILGNPWAAFNVTRSIFTTRGEIAMEAAPLLIHAPNANDEAAGMVAVVASDHASGWLVGDVKGAFLSSIAATPLAGGVDPDRSANGNDLTVFGTITRAPVATGAELMAYSGFSESNYLEATVAGFSDALFCMGWQQTGGVWSFEAGVVASGVLDGVTITGSTLRIAGTKPKALIRISATAPTADQIAKIYRDERVMFESGAMVTLGGSSDAVTAVDFDAQTERLQVGTSGGRSTFRGFRRIEHSATPVTKAISAVGNLIGFV